MTEETVQAATMLTSVAPNVLLTKAKDAVSVVAGHG